LVKFFKGKIKLTEFKDVKKDIQLFVRVGRNIEMSLEEKLVELRELAFKAVNESDSKSCEK
jgi:hypothetical protein